MELIVAAVVAFCAVFMTVFLARKFAAGRSHPAPLPAGLTAEAAAAKYLAAHPFKARASTATLRDSDARSAA